MNVKLTFFGEKIPNAVVVPLSTIVTQSDGQMGVLVPDQDNQAQFQPVTAGATAGSQIQILQGVLKGERVFTSLPPDYKTGEFDTSAAL